MTSPAFNPRYANYARLNGRDPEAMLVFDKERLPGAHMMEFMLWNGDRLREFGKVKPEAFIGGGLRDHAAYDAWLTAHVDAQLATVAA